MATETKNVAIPVGQAPLETKTVVAAAPAQAVQPPSNVDRHRLALIEYGLTTRFLRADSLSGLMSASKSGLVFSDWGYDTQSKEPSRQPSELDYIDSFTNASGWRKFLERDCATQPTGYTLISGAAGNSRWLPLPVTNFNPSAQGAGREDLGNYYHIYAGDARSPVTSTFFKLVHPNIPKGAFVVGGGRTHFATMPIRLDSNGTYGPAAFGNLISLQALQAAKDQRLPDVLGQLLDVVAFAHQNGWILGLDRDAQVWLSENVVLLFPGAYTCRGRGEDVVGGLSQAGDLKTLQSWGATTPTTLPGERKAGMEVSYRDPLPAGSADEIKNDRPGTIRVPPDIILGWLQALTGNQGMNFNELNILFSRIEMMMALAAKGILPPVSLKHAAAELDSIFLNNLGSIGYVRTPATFYMGEQQTREFLQNLPQRLYQYQSDYDSMRMYGANIGTAKILDMHPFVGSRTLSPIKWSPRMRSAEPLPVNPQETKSTLPRMNMGGSDSWDLSRWGVGSVQTSSVPGLQPALQSASQDVKGPFLVSVPRKDAKRYPRKFIVQPVPVPVPVVSAAPETKIETKTKTGTGTGTGSPKAGGEMKDFRGIEVKTPPKVRSLDWVADKREPVIIFGVRFDGDDLSRVFQGTSLAGLLNKVGSQSPSYLTPDDVGLLHEFLSGRVMPYVLYSELSPGGFAELMRSGSYLNFYEFLPLRHVIDGCYVMGRPVREQFRAQRDLLLQQANKYGFSKFAELVATIVGPEDTGDTGATSTVGLPILATQVAKM